MQGQGNSKGKNGGKKSNKQQRDRGGARPPWLSDQLLPPNVCRTCGCLTQNHNAASCVVKPENFRWNELIRRLGLSPAGAGGRSNQVAAVGNSAHAAPMTSGQGMQSMWPSLPPPQMQPPRQESPGHFMTEQANAMHGIQFGSFGDFHNA